MVEWGISILGIVISVLFAWIIAHRYGDVAGTAAAIRYQESKETSRRGAVLEALRAQAASLELINTHNKTATDKTAIPIHLLPIPYPIEPFETAMLSEWGIPVSKQTVDSIVKYTTKARELNVLIGALQDAHLSAQAGSRHIAGKRETQTFIFDQANVEMPPLIESLKFQIDKEIS